MREADVRVVQLDHRLLRGRLERLQDTLPFSVGRGHHLDRRSRQSGNEQQDVERLAGEARQPASEQLAQALGHAQRLARGRSRVRSDQLAAQLERKERVARGRLLHAGELGPCQLEPQPLLEQVPHGGERQRADGQPLEPLVRERALELDRARKVRSQPQSGQEHDRLVSETPERDLERARRRWVEPLDIVEGDEDRRLLGQGTKNVQHRKPDCVRIGRRLAGLHEQQRHLERPPPGRRERRPDLAEHVAEQFRETGERERGLGLDSPAGQHGAEPAASVLDARLPEHGLADSRLSREEKRARPQSGVRQQRLDDAKLLPPPDDRRRHFVWIVTRGGRFAYRTPRLRAGRAVRRRRRPPRRAAVARAPARCRPTR